MKVTAKFIILMQENSETCEQAIYEKQEVRKSLSQMSIYY